MISSAHIKIAFPCIIIFFMYDAVLDLVDPVLSFIHILYEWFEFGIDILVEHVFHTNHQQSQIIAFYIILSIALMGVYFLWRILPRLYIKIKRNSKAAWLRRKRRITYNWKTMPPFDKFKMITACTTGFTCMLMLI